VVADARSLGEASGLVAGVLEADPECRSLSLPEAAGDVRAVLRGLGVRTDPPGARAGERHDIAGAAAALAASDFLQTESGAARSCLLQCVAAASSPTGSRHGATLGEAMGRTLEHAGGGGGEVIVARALCPTALAHIASLWADPRQRRAARAATSAGSRTHFVHDHAAGASAAGYTVLRPVLAPAAMLGRAAA
jgi:hypothetical protein